MENLSLNILSDDVMKALCTTLLYSLWQGLILAAFTGLVIAGTRKLTPGRRYNLLIAGLVLFAAAAICTFIIQLNRLSAHPNIQVAFQAHITNTSSPLIKTDQPIAYHQTVADTVTGYLNGHAYTIVLIWFLIVSARSLQLLSGLHGLYHLRRKAMFTIDGDWEKQVKIMADKMGIQRIVGIAESGIAKVPMVIGHLKPLILLPIGLITAMPPAEIEAILVHELAHIRRRDYLVNLLQSLLEIVFFFNPAVLWLSTLIRIERENCCDDIAIAQTSNKVNYIRALVFCQEYQLSAPAYAMALRGKQNQLITRVKRMASNKNQSLNLVEKSLLAICLVSAGLLTVAFSNAEKLNKLLISKTKTVLHTEGNFKQEALKTKLNLLAIPSPLKRVGATLTDTLTAKKIRDARSRKLASARQQLLDRQAQKLDSDKRELALQSQKFDSDKQKEEFRLKQAAFAKQQEDYKLQQAAYAKQQEDYKLEQAAYDRQKKDYRLQNDSVKLKEAVRLQKLEVDKQREAVRLQKLEVDKQREAVRLQKLEVDKQREAVRLQKLEVDKQREASHLQRLELLKAKAAIDSVSQLYKKSAQPAKPARSAIPAKSARPAKQADSATPASSTGSAATAVPARTGRTPDYKPYAAASSKSNADHDLIMGEMANDGIITKGDNTLSFKLSDKEFIVNGKKQPDDVYQKYRAQYVKVTGHNGWTWYYNYDTSAKKSREEKTTVNID
jgi:bla regulator protein BlaR1